MGWIAQFLSKAVITGFLAGAAIDVTIGELPKLTGTSSSGDSAWRELGTWIQGLGETHWTTLVVGLVSLGVILGLRFAAPAVPGRARAGGRGVARIGPVRPRRARRRARRPRSARLAEPGAARLRQLVRTHLSTIGIASVALLLIGFSQTAGDARAFATRHRYRIDVNQESIAQGMANAGAGLFQGMPVSTSLSASSLNESAGARTPVASLITGGLVLLTLIVLAPLFSHLPKAVLAAVIIDAVVFGMIDVGELRRLHRVARFDFWIAVAAILGVLSAGVLAGVVIGVVLSLGWLIYVATSPRMPVLGREPGTQVFRELDENPGDETFPGHRRRCASTAASSSPPPRRSTIASGRSSRTAIRSCMRSSSTWKASTSSTRRGRRSWPSFTSVAKADGVTLRLARVKPQVLAVLEADGMVDDARRRPASTGTSTRRSRRSSPRTPEWPLRWIEPTDARVPA